MNKKKKDTRLFFPTDKDNICKWELLDKETKSVIKTGYQNNDFISLNKIFIGQPSMTIIGEPIFIVDKYDRISYEGKLIRIVLIKSKITGRLKITTFSMLKNCNYGELNYSDVILHDNKGKYHAIVRNGTATLGGAEPRYALDRYGILY